MAKKVFELPEGFIVNKVYRNGLLQERSVDYTIQQYKLVFDKELGVPSLFGKHGKELIIIQGSMTFTVKY